MLKIINILMVTCLLGFCLVTFAKAPKVDEIELIQSLINNAYKLGYVDAAPVEMSFIEKKVIEARTARDNRKKKILAQLIPEIKADLKIVKKRYEVNQLNKRLTQLQDQNMQSKKILDELKRQL
jgi:hypothetical protein